VPCKAGGGTVLKEKYAKLHLVVSVVIQSPADGFRQSAPIHQQFGDEHCRGRCFFLRVGERRILAAVVVVVAAAADCGELLSCYRNVILLSTAAATVKEGAGY